MQRRVMAAELALSHADGTICTVKAFRVRQFGVDKPEEEAYFWCSSIRGYLA